jgi:hypothetical protein
MTIQNIIEIKNKNRLIMAPIKEKQDIYIPNIKDNNISRRNGMIYAITGSGGSGKSSMLLNMFKNKNEYRNKFHNIYYICPMSSYLSVVKHPFEKHDKVYHEITPDILNDIYNELIAKKERYEELVEKKKKRNKKHKNVNSDIESDTDDDEEPEIEYSCVIIDDMASSLKDKNISRELNKMIIKARHICCSFIITLQSYYYLEKLLRKQLTYITIFKSKNIEEWNSIAKELLNLNKDDALKLYNYVYNEPYTHIDIDLVSNKYYKNFNLLEIEN